MKKTKAEIIEIMSGDGYDVFAREGAGEGSPAVKAEYAFSVGSDLGTHNFAGTFAVAQVGSLDGDENFAPDKWQEEDYTTKKITNRRMIGLPKTYEGWSPDDDDSDEINWDAYMGWVQKFCGRVL